MVLTLGGQRPGPSFAAASNREIDTPTDPQARIPFMKNWKLIAEASGFNIPESDIERLIVPLQGLDEAFRKIAVSFPPDTDSAQIFEASPESK